MPSPAALDRSHFAPAELSALRLDGDAFAVGEGLVPADQPVDAPTRAASLAEAVRRGDLVLRGRTAAWVHGALPLLGRPYDLATDRRGPRGRRAPGQREVRFGPHDVVRLRGVRVTSALRTAFDLALEDDPPEAAVLRDLLRLAGLSPDSAALALRPLPGAPNKLRAIVRIRALGTPPSQPDTTRAAPIVRLSRS